jgi:hypothetical protein
VSSPAEWFAEQYAQYFRTGGKGLEDDVKQKMDAIAKMSFDPNKKGKDGEQGALQGGGGGGAKASGGGGGGGAAAGGKIKPEEAEGQGGSGATGADKEKKPPVETERLPFAW